jgi:hypothetical protein
MHHKVIRQHLKAEATDLNRLPQLQYLVPAKAAEPLVVPWRQPARGDDKWLVPFLVQNAVPSVTMKPAGGVGGAVALREVGAAPAVARKHPRRAGRNRRRQRALSPGGQPGCFTFCTAALKRGQNQQPPILGTEPAESGVAAGDGAVQPG